MKITLPMTKRQPLALEISGQLADLKACQDKRNALTIAASALLGEPVLSDIIITGKHPAAGSYKVSVMPSKDVPHDMSKLVLLDGRSFLVEVTDSFMGGTIATEIGRGLPKIIILGHGRHGKDTVAEILRKSCGFSFESSSLACAEVVMMPYFASIGRPYSSVEECYADRHTGDNRSVWFDQIKAYNSGDGTRLIRAIFDRGHDIYVGMRNRIEFEEARKLVDYVLWVDASKRGVPLESRSSFDIDYDPETMILIENDGTEDDLWWQVEEIATEWFMKGEK